MSAFEQDQWRKLAPYLDEGLGLTAEARAAWLDSLRHSDPALAADVDRLLALYEAADRDAFLDSGTAIARPRLRLTGEVVGAYTLVAQIGRGGMGSVWRATRGDGRFERDVAIKFLNIALAGRGEARFRREGRILGRLSHPHIAQLLDAGTTPNGEAYLVLELVEGRPLDEYCETHRLPVEARVRVFLQVLDAVAYAHGNLVVHRDVKPANVLVDHDGRAKLLDFGIAKLLEREGEAAPATELTREGGPALTLAYAAPEQVSGDPVTAATDVYSLGVLLYQLLTGRHPAADSLGSYSETVRAILEIDPQPPSKAAPERVRGPRRGDLDTIVARAVRKAPSERYASATAFADDLRRSLRNEPIAARPDSVVYRARKFARRHAFGIAVVAIIVGALSVGLLVANRERAVAQTRFEQVRQLSARLFEIDARVRQLPGAASTRQYIVDTALEYLERLSATAAADPALAFDLGTAYMRVARVQGVPISSNLGQTGAAEESLRIAERHAELARSREPANRLALLRTAQVAHDRMILAGVRREIDTALRHAERAAARLEQYLGGGPVHAEEAEQVVITGMNVANRFVLEDRTEEGARLAERVVEIARATNQPGQAAAGMMVLASALRARAELDRALATSAEATRLLESTPGGSTMGRQATYVLALSRQAAILGEPDSISLGRWEEAVPLLERAMAVAGALAEKDPNDTLSRERLSTAGRHLAGILTPTDPARALKVYDVILRRVGEIAGSPRARRDEARFLARSTYALRLVGRAGAVPGRLEGAFERLRAVGLYPAESVELGTELYDALRAEAEHHGAGGNLTRARDLYRALLEKVIAADPDTQTNLADALDMSGLYGRLADLERDTGNTAEVVAASAATRALAALGRAAAGQFVCSTATRRGFPCRGVPLIPEPPLERVMKAPSTRSTR